MPLMNTHASVAKARYSMQSCKKTQIKHSSEKRVDPNQSNSLSENMLIHVPYESIDFKIIRFLFNYTFYFKNIFRYAICLDSLKIPYFVAPDLGPFVLEK